MKKIIIGLTFFTTIIMAQEQPIPKGLRTTHLLPIDAGVGINNTNPQAILDVTSTNSGILIPRMTTTQRNAISTPQSSMLIFNTTTNSFEAYISSVWTKLLNPTDIIGKANLSGGNAFTGDQVFNGNILTSGLARFNNDVIFAGGSIYNSSDNYLTAGKSIFGFSDSGSTETFRLNASNGKIIASGTITGAPATLSTEMVTKGQLYEGVNITGNDLNDLYSAGFYFGGTLTNAPESDIIGNYYIFVEHSDVGNTKQTATSQGDSNIPNKTYTRVYNGSWSVWFKLLTTPDLDDYATLSDLDGYIPLSGTTVGNPISGDLEVSEENKIFRSNYDNDGYNGISFFGDAVIISGNANGSTSQITVKEDSIELSSDYPSSIGLVGVQEFSNNGTDRKIYPQTGWVQDEIAKQTGWATYTDTVYTSGSPFSISSGATSTLPNNAGTIINTYLPTGVTSFYNSSTSKITPQNIGDYYIATLRFKAKNTATLGGLLDFGIDIGGALGVQFEETKIFAKGAGVEHDFSIVVPMYALSTFVSNGGLIKIGAIGGDVTIYNISLQVARTDKN